jgi:hypothetical protein
MEFPVWVKPALMGVGCGAVAMSVIGFSQLGWKTSQTANDLAQEQADTAVVAALLPFCVAKAEQVSQQATLAKVRAEDSAYTRSDMVMQAGWATVGDKARPDNALATACATSLHSTKS